MRSVDPVLQEGALRCLLMVGCLFGPRTAGGPVFARLTTCLQTRTAHSISPYHTIQYNKVRRRLKQLGLLWECVFELVSKMGLREAMVRARIICGMFVRTLTTFSNGDAGITKGVSRWSGGWFQLSPILRHFRETRAHVRAGPTSGTPCDCGKRTAHSLDVCCPTESFYCSAYKFCFEAPSSGVEAATCDSIVLDS